MPTTPLYSPASPSNTFALAAPVAVIAATSTATAAPTNVTDGYGTGPVARVRTDITYGGTVTSARLRLWIRHPTTGIWFRSVSSDDIGALAPTTTTAEVREWNVGFQTEVFVQLEAVAGGGTVAVDVQGVAGGAPSYASASGGGGAGLTDTQLRATAVPVSQNASGSVSGTLQSAAAATGAGTPLTVLGMAACVFTVTGTFVGTVTFQGTEDGTTWSSLTAVQLGTSVLATTATAAGVYECSVGGLQSVRANVTAYTSGAITATAHAVPVNFAPRTVSAQVQPAVGVSTDRSVTITTGGTAQQAAAANTARKYLFVQNPSGSGGTAWFSTLATAVAASPSIELPPGSSYENPTHFCQTGAVSVIHPTTGAKLTVLEV